MDMPMPWWRILRAAPQPACSRIGPRSHGRQWLDRSRWRAVAGYTVSLSGLCFGLIAAVDRMAGNGQKQPFINLSDYVPALSG